MNRSFWVFVVIAMLGIAHAGRAQTPITCGQTVSGSTTTSSQTNTYSFAGSAGQTFIFAFYWSSAEPGSADIYFPGTNTPGTNMTAAATGGNAITVTLPSDGAYTIAVHSSADNSTASYNLSAQSPVAGGCNGYAMKCGVYLSEVINAHTQIDSYELIANSNETVTLSISGFPGVEMDVCDPSGSNTVTITSSETYTFTDTGEYTVLVHSDSYTGTGEYNMLMSPVLVGCGNLATVTVSPATQTGSVGSSATFTAMGTNAPTPYFYQWYFNNTFITGATNSTYVISEVQTSDAGTYSVIVNNPAGPSDPASAILIVTTNTLVTPILTWANPAPITYGTALTAIQLDATATWAGTNVPGGYLYAPPSGTVLNAGANQTLSVTFSPTDANTFKTATASASLTVLPASLLVTAGDASRAYGAPNPAFTGGLSGLQNGDAITVSYSCSAIANSPVDSYPIVPILSDPDNRLPNYTVTTNEGSLTVTPAPLTITANGTNKPYGQTLTFTGQEFTSSGLQNGETIDSVTLTSAGAGAGATVAGSPYPIIPTHATGGTFSPGNYSITYVNGLLTVVPVNLASLSLNMYIGLNIVGPIGASYQIQSAPPPPTHQLPAWTTVTNVTVASQPYVYIDITSITNANRLYQLVPVQ
jgi:hypothetical protein